MLYLILVVSTLWIHRTWRWSKTGTFGVAMSANRKSSIIRYLPSPLRWIGASTQSWENKYRSPNRWSPDQESSQSGRILHPKALCWSRIRVGSRIIVGSSESFVQFDVPKRKRSPTVLVRPPVTTKNRSFIIFIDFQGHRVFGRAQPTSSCESWSRHQRLRSAILRFAPAVLDHSFMSWRQSEMPRSTVG